MLFFKELKKIVFSASFLILLIAIIAMAVSQDILNFRNRKMELPEQGQNYGTQPKELPEVIMPAALNSLFNEFCANNYTAYPIGFYKNVKLNDKKIQQMAEILSALTGINADNLKESAKGNTRSGETFHIGDGTNLPQDENGNFTIAMPDDTLDNQAVSFVTLKENISYEDFKHYMAQTDNLIGGGSKYAATLMTINFGQVPITYEEALAQYNLSKDTDHFTGAYARLFADYLGVGGLSILPVFLAVALCLKDKRSQMNPLIYSRKFSSTHIILARYFAILTAVMIPTIILSYISNASVWNLFQGMTLDYLAPLKYGLGWLLPSVMISAAVGMLFTELTDTPIAIAVQGLWWFLEINMGIGAINGNYSLFRLAPRHNSLQYTQVFIDDFESLAMNRLFFAGISLVLVVATILIYEQKRRGRLNGYDKIKKIIANWTNHKNKFAA